MGNLEEPAGSYLARLLCVSFAHQSMVSNLYPCACWRNYELGN